MKDVREIEQKMAGRTGLEPATSYVTGRRSNQLNYRPAKSLTALQNTLVGATGIEPVTSSMLNRYAIHKTTMQALALQA